MSRLLEDTIFKLSSMNSKELEDNWKQLEPYEDVGPLAKEFIESNYKIMETIKNEMFEISRVPKERLNNK